VKTLANYFVFVNCGSSAKWDSILNIVQWKKIAQLSVLCNMGLALTKLTALDLNKNRIYSRYTVGFGPPREITILSSKI
jgi:hypothetical protein